MGWGREMFMGQLKGDAWTPMDCSTTYESRYCRSLSLFNRVIAGRLPRTCSGERGFHCLVIYFTPKEYLQGLVFEDSY